MLNASSIQALVQDFNCAYQESILLQVLFIPIMLMKPIFFSFHSCCVFSTLYCDWSVFLFPVSVALFHFMIYFVSSSYFFSSSGCERSKMTVLLCLILLFIFCCRVTCTSLFTIYAFIPTFLALRRRCYLMIYHYFLISVLNILSFS